MIKLWQCPFDKKLFYKSVLHPSFAKRKSSEFSNQMTRNRNNSHLSRDMHLLLKDVFGSYQNHNITIKYIL